MKMPPQKPAAWSQFAGPDASDALDGSPGPKTGAELLDAVMDFGCRFIAFPNSESAVAWVAWVIHAHLLDQLDSTPRLAVVAPEKQSGKTRVLEVTETLVPRPLRASSTTTAVLFRLIDSDDRPTVLLDEADAIWSERGANEELRALLNAGHRRGSDVHRMVGEGSRMKARSFSTFAAVALAGIGDLPDTLMDRSVAMRMKRRSPHERVERWRFAEGQRQGEALRSEIAAWLRNVGNLPVPDDLEDVSDRAADVWEPLFMVGDLAGGRWPLLVRDACRVLTALQPSQVSLRVRLLSDLRDVWPHPAAFTPTATLLQLLGEMDEAPWASHGPLGEHGLTPRRLGSLLAHFGVQSTHSDDKSVRGYRRVDLQDPWARYLPAGEPSEPSKASGDTSTMQSCQHGMTGGHLPDAFIGGRVACPECRSGAA